MVAENEDEVAEFCGWLHGDGKGERDTDERLGWSLEINGIGEGREIWVVREDG